MTFSLHRSNCTPSGTPASRAWAPHMDPRTLAYLGGHRDMNLTKRYVHPQEQTIRAAMDRAQVANSGRTFGHTGQKTDLENTPVPTPTISAAIARVWLRVLVGPEGFEPSTNGL